MVFYIDEILATISRDYEHSSPCGILDYFSFDYHIIHVGLLSQRYDLIMNNSIYPNNN